MAPDGNDPPTGDQGGGDSSGGGSGTTTPPPDDDGLGEAGKRALDAERSSRRAAEKRARDLEAELTRVRESSMSETEKAIEKAKREAKAEATSAYNRRILQAEMRAAAAGKLADPEDAIRFLDLDDFTVGDDGAIDQKAVTKALDELVKAKPYLAASATRPTGDADQGTRRTSSGGSLMNDLIKSSLPSRSR